MSSLGSLALLLGGLVAVIAGAEILLDGLLATASRIGTSAFVVTVVISGFELENLAAGIAANAKGLPGAAAGTFLGGTTFLAIGVAGLGGLIAPIRARLKPAALLWTAAAPVPLLVLSLNGELTRIDGALLVVWFLVAIFGLARSGREAFEGEGAERRRWPLAWLLGGLAILTVGGDLLAQGLRGVVDRVGVSQTLLGNTALAASVEGEEVVRVAVPTKRGRADLGVANITGTIVHFISLNAGIIALVNPLSFDDATRYLHLPVAVAATWLFCGLLAWRHAITRVAGAGLIALYAAYVAAAVLVG